MSNEGTETIYDTGMSVSSGANVFPILEWENQFDVELLPPTAVRYLDIQKVVPFIPFGSTHSVGTIDELQAEVQRLTRALKAEQHLSLERARDLAQERALHEATKAACGYAEGRLAHWVERAEAAEARVAELERYVEQLKVRVATGNRLRQESDAAIDQVRGLLESCWLERHGLPARLCDALHTWLRAHPEPADNPGAAMPAASGLVQCNGCGRFFVPELGRLHECTTATPAATGAEPKVQLPSYPEKALLQHLACVVPESSWFFRGHLQHVAEYLSRAGLALVPAAELQMLKCEHPTQHHGKCTVCGKEPLDTVSLAQYEADVPTPERKRTTLEEVANLAREVLATNNEECLDALDLCEQLEVILQRDEKEKDG